MKITDRFLRLLVLVSFLFAGCQRLSPEEKYREAKSLYNDGKYDEALKLVNEALIEDSTLAYAFEFRGKLLYHFTDTAQAEKDFDHSLEMAFGDDMRKNLLDDIIEWEIGDGNKEKVKENLRRELELYKDDSTKRMDIFNHVADKYLELSDTVEAIATYEQALKAHPKWIDPHEGLGDIYANSRKYEKAIKQYEICSKAKKASSRVEYSLAQCYTLTGKTKAALPHYKLAADGGHKKACEKYRELTAVTKYYSSTLCCDGSTSESTGRGTCSHHGGVCGIKRTPYKEYLYECR